MKFYLNCPIRIEIITGIHIFILFLPQVGTLCKIFYPEWQRGVKWKHKVPTQGKNNINIWLSVIISLINYYHLSCKNYVLTNTSNLASDTSSAVKTLLTLSHTLPYDIEPDCCVEKITTRPGQIYYVCVLMSAYSLNQHLFQINIIGDPHYRECKLYMCQQGPSWPWSYGCWILNYLCNQCLSPLLLWVWISIWARCTTLCDKVCQWLATGRWFSAGPPVSSTN